MSSETYDVFTLGETMVRFTPKGFTRLEEAAELEVRIGGSESNVAIALARLGLRAAWAGKLPLNPLGELVARRIRSFGVDVSQARWVDHARMGLYFIEPGTPPRSSLVLYDRSHSAASTMAPEDFDWSVLDRARHVHLTGITPALSATALETVARAIREARARGRTVSFDVNYRARLWPAEAAREALLPLLREVDLLISTLGDAAQVFLLDGAPEEVARAMGELTGASHIALTLGGEGALLWDRSMPGTRGRAGTFHRAEPFPVHAVDRVGAGDAFDAGLLWGFLQGDAPRGMVFGMAMAAIKHTIPGDEFISSLAEVETLLETGHRDIQR
jgi:2-dehydro-3-deoxygluconokinase